MKNLSRRTAGTIYVIIASLMWSLGGVLIKNINAPGEFIAMGRSLIAFITLCPFIRLKHLKNIKKFIILGISYAVCLTCFVLSTKMTAAANAIAIQSSSPLFIFVGLWIFKKQVDKSKFIPMLMILLGIITFLLEPVSGSNIAGNTIALTSGISFAICLLLFGEDYGLSTLGLIAMLNLFVVPVTAFMVPWSTSLFIMDIRSWILLFILGSVQIGLAYVFFYTGRRMIPAVDASILTLIEPMLNPIWVFLSIGEIPSTYALIGYSLILSALIITVIIEKNQAQQLDLDDELHLENVNTNT